LRKLITAEVGTLVNVLTGGSIKKGSVRNEVRVSDIANVMDSRMSSRSVANHTGSRTLESEPGAAFIRIRGFSCPRLICTSLSGSITASIKDYSFVVRGRPCTSFRADPQNDRSPDRLFVWPRWPCAQWRGLKLVLRPHPARPDW